MKLSHLYETVIFIFLPCMSVLIYGEDYFDLEDELLFHLIQDVKVRKCSCKSDEAVINGTCQSVNGTLVPVLIYEDALVPEFIDLGQFNVIEHSDVKCGFGKYVTRINPVDLFIMLTGELFHPPPFNSSYSPFEYCVDHVVDESGTIVWEVHMCMESIKVPVCCPFTNGNFGYCDNPSLPFMYGYSIIEDPVLEGIPADRIRCEEGETLENNVLVDIRGLDTTPSLFLNYNGNESELVVYTTSVKGFYLEYFKDRQFCITPELKEDDVTYTASYCVKDPLIEHSSFCANFSCVRKCCNVNEVYSYDEVKCVSYNETLLWSPTFKRPNSSQEVEPPKNLKFTYGFPLCASYYPLKHSTRQDDYILLPNGDLYILNLDESFPTPKFCIDNFLLNGEVGVEEIALLCFPEVAKDSRCVEVRKTLIPPLMIVSCLFMLITLIVYASIPELHAKLHGKSLLSHVASLFVAYLSLGVTNIVAPQLDMSLCKISAFIIHISFLSSFFWLSVMCFDIWWTLRSMRPVAETSENSRRRFVYYSIYAWGCPVIIGTVTLCMELIPNSPEYSHLILPGFGVKSCWFKGNMAVWVYFYVFVSIITVFNIIFFICVAIILIQAQRANNSILHTSNKQHKERVWIYLKLFVVMGITWVYEVISFKEGSCEYWFFTDVINALQGFFIFLIFICKKNIYMKLRTRGTNSTRKLRRMVTGSSSYGSSTQVTQQTSLDSSRKLSSSLHYHISKLSRQNTRS